MTPSHAGRRPIRDGAPHGQPERLPTGREDPEARDRLLAAATDLRDPSRRASLEDLGASAWAAGLAYLHDQALRRPVGPQTYGERRRAHFGPTGQPGPAPSRPRPAEEVLELFRRRVAPFAFNSTHPRAFAYFTPAPLPMAVAAEGLAAWMNQSVDIFATGPTGALVEEELVRWLADAVGYPPASFGVLTSGGVMANLMALAVARDRHLARLLGRRSPPRGSHLDGATVYVSDQAHFSIARACSLLGFPRSALRPVTADPDFRLRAEPVARAIARDRARGLRPFLVVATAGTTNTGAVDDLPELARLARRERLWLHVDAAYGGAARLSSRDADRVAGLERADSITLDPHKWLAQPHDLGALLVRRREDLHRTFHVAPAYYRTPAGAERPLNWVEYTLEGTRRFRALKLWMSWHQLGTAGLGALVEHGNDLAAHLAARCREADDLEAVPAHPQLSVVCFRHLPGGAAAAATLAPGILDRHQDQLQRALERSGEGWVSTTRLRGRIFLRAGLVNALTTAADIDAVLASLRRLAAEAARQASIAAAPSEGGPTTSGPGA
ncbi:MAG TPA: aminotransferase class I/II-fold pyridoxal phosphate-dependent enzyme [Verrucomicrobiae bacterium]|nr:aminotransferase class I/II-fold pyridoxal phosphate-dependent enzyme [Verrucomicrobiae bacterium]